MNLVTGGTGLVGSYLLFDLVKAGKKVRAIKRKNSDLSFVKKIFLASPLTPLQVERGMENNLFGLIEWVEGDVLDVYSLVEAMQGVEQVYHCAGMVSHHPKDVYRMMKINVEGTANVMNMALEQNIKKVCHTSSVAALGEKLKNDLMTEECKWKTSPKNSNYAISKYCGEREAWRAAEEGLNVVIVNPSIVIGAGDWQKSSGKLFDVAYKGLKYYTSGITGFVDARDVSKTMIALMESNISNERFIISAEDYSYQNIFNLLCENLGTKKPHIKVSETMGEIAWRVSSLSRLFSNNAPNITKEIIRGGFEKHNFSNEKIKKAIGINFISVEQSVKEVSEIYLKEKNINC